MPTGCPSEDALQLYFDAELDELAAVAVQQHIASCERCAAWLHRTREVVETMVWFHQSETRAPREMPGGFLPPKAPRPSAAQLAEWLGGATAQATDGCEVEPDGACPHRHVSWLVYLKLLDRSTD